jgi:hypothetical protein
MNRRAFIARLAAGGGGLAVGRSIGVHSQTSRLGPLGIQLWSVRHELQHDLPRTLERLASIGYRRVELVSWFGHFGLSAAGRRKIDDPKAYTRPWTVHLNQHLVLDTDLLEYYCLENEKDVAHFPAK